MVPLATALPWPAPAEGPACGTAGAEALSRVTPDGPVCCPVDFCRKASALLDLVLVAQDVLADLKAALEEEALP